jgi:hypothetical protein
LNFYSQAGWLKNSISTLRLNSFTVLGLFIDIEFSPEEEERN